MPLTGFQRGLLAVLGPAGTPDSYLASGTALHFEPNSTAGIPLGEQGLVP